jgi:hypothetical protein
MKPDSIKEFGLFFARWGYHAGVDPAFSQLSSQHANSISACEVISLVI